MSKHFLMNEYMEHGKVFKDVVDAMYKTCKSKQTVLADLRTTWQQGWHMYPYHIAIYCILRSNKNPDKEHVQVIRFDVNVYKKDDIYFACTFCLPESDSIHETNIRCQYAKGPKGVALLESHMGEYFSKLMAETVGKFTVHTEYTICLTGMRELSTTAFLTYDRSTKTLSKIDKEDLQDLSLWKRQKLKKDFKALRELSGLLMKCIDPVVRLYE